MAESLDDKRLSRSTLSIAIMILDLDLTTHQENIDCYVTSRKANPNPIYCNYIHACLNIHL